MEPSFWPTQTVVYYQDLKKIKCEFWGVELLNVPKINGDLELALIKGI